MNYSSPLISSDIANTALRTEQLSVYYGNTLAVRDVYLDIPKNKIVSFIGPSGCGKSTVLRCFNRMNDLIPGAKVAGRITFHGQDIHAKTIDPVELRRRIGMVFQKPNPFPKSIYENIAFGARINGYQGNMDELVENSLRGAALWNEVKDKLRASGLSLSGGQQQRLCIARAIAIEPEIILMDEPCSALDPISTLRIEELMQELKEQYTIAIVTHNMQQASRTSDYTAFFNAEPTSKGGKVGHLVEYNRTELIFQSPQEEKTKDYVSGRFG
ncbi:phosphate ABC transporter ATP-binding protein PstB [Prochlorothrix hollandica]|uniref:Phosphate ABC transporter ATP-binding protein n=1 Tax=Prochlorothrix hollandica PCC 9006 = CALU 1027 TaxID=317619 RepID=A0A0M2PT20_PROHO|nr:phosphate ABC transporter ATP-binding protein PstB [Prochlorothrix hollandica]KKI99274.1 phosphate ABC transporter ATP-binding protein [Prochlorothrix hollandica PCC 9006 = CALU 1027]